MRITSLEAAHSQLRMAVHLFFSGGDPVCIHSLACNAREVYEKACKAQGRPRFFDYIMESFPNEKPTELWNSLNAARNFFKHGLEVKEIEFTEDMNDSALLIASNDCVSLCGEDAPVEAHVFLCWTFTVHEAVTVDYLPIGRNDFIILGLDSEFPGLRTGPRSRKVEFGRRVLEANLSTAVPVFNS